MEAKDAGLMRLLGVGSWQVPLKNTSVDLRPIPLRDYADAGIFDLVFASYIQQHWRQVFHKRLGSPGPSFQRTKALYLER